MQQEPHHEAFALPGAPPAAPRTINTRDSESPCDSDDSNIFNSPTPTDASAKRKAHDSAQTAAPKRAKTDETEGLSQNIGSLAPTNSINNSNIDNMTAADMLEDPIGVVKQWLAEMESRPRTLTPAELNAIIALKATLGRIPEPDLGMVNWVGTLHKYRDARQHYGTTFEIEEMTNMDKSFSAICVFRGELDAPAMRFPGEHGGLYPVDHSGTLGVPSFLKKKNAKTYAAKCCVEWLMANGYMPADGSTATLNRTKPKPFRITSTEGAALAAQPESTASSGTAVTPQDNATPAASTNNKAGISKPPNGAPPPANGTPHSAHGTLRHANGTPRPANGTPRPANGTPQPANSTPRHVNGSAPLTANSTPRPTTTAIAPTPAPASVKEEPSDSEVLPSQRVQELCETLGIRQPQYVITPSVNHGSGFFDGRVNFGADDPYFEDGVGRVYGGYTKKGTREGVAERVLKALLEIKAKREAEYKAVVGGDDDKGGD